MSQIWKENKVIPVTLVKVGDNKVSFIRTKAKDGYSAVQLNSGKTKREFRMDRGVKLNSELNLGDTISVSVFNPGDKVTASGTSKGRGFQGVVKRHGFGGGPKTHGQKNRFRAPGSIGNTSPQRVIPGRRMAGHMGDVRVTVKNIIVREVDAEHGIIALEGAVPGAPGSLVELRAARQVATKNK